jgi:hypothetical protein
MLLVSSDCQRAKSAIAAGLNVNLSGIGIGKIRALNARIIGSGHGRSERAVIEWVVRGKRDPTKGGNFLCQ